MSNLSDVTRSVLFAGAIALLPFAAVAQDARLFRDGNPIVMIVAGGADTVRYQEEFDMALASIRRLLNGKT